MPVCPKCGTNTSTHFNKPPIKWEYDCSACGHVWIDPEDFWDEALNHLHKILGDWIKSVDGKRLPKSVTLNNYDQDDSIIDIARKVSSLRDQIKPPKVRK